MKGFTFKEIKEFVSKPLFDEKILLNKDPQWPKISIVTPSYNQAEFLERTILSVLNQNYPNLEYIIIDGCSTDGSVEIIKKYEKYLTYCVSEKDSGTVEALTKGFAKATGAILAWLNSDDLYLPDALNTVAVSFSREPHIDVVYGNMYRIDPKDRIIVEHRQTPFLRLGYLYGGFDLLQPGTFWQKDVFLKCGGMDSTCSFSFDTHLFFRFVSQGAKFKFVRNFVACFRVHPNSKTSTISHIGNKESAEIRGSYISFPFDSFCGRFFRNLAKSQRVFFYVLQGDLVWLIRRLKERLRFSVELGS